MLAFTHLSFMVLVMGTTQISARPQSELLIRVPAAYLERRQTGTTSVPDVPPGCETTCDPVNSVLSAGCTVSTCCQSTFEMEYFNCFECVANALNVTDFSVPQEDLDALVDACAALSLALPKLTFPGQNPNRTISSVASSASSTASSGSPSPTAQITVSNPAQTSLFSTSSTSQLAQSTVTSIPSNTSPVSPSPSTSTTSNASSTKRMSYSWLGGKVVSLGIAAALYFSL
ncbi:hypothetical protein CPB84DRAFT_1780975 [Gymnopilus junonius]|uniref:Extracellular membrane protein CFEM domain-containing protein n=1 Tax=Gymnopilus junonius TaxID=109634 RepID=A0A9P5NN23_GYMJU|nr:hypothetical protein CPB84DRAFT_1780975 [Gymnopilus junonius]